jgi:hypothetical protein
MKSIDSEWNELKASQSRHQEAVRIEDVTARLRENHIHYHVAVSDVATGATVPVAELGQKPGARLRVDLTLSDEGNGRVLTWEPRDPENVLPLLRE